MRLVRFFFAASWKTIFTSLVEQELSENNLLSTIARLGKEWRVTVEVNPRSCAVAIVRLRLTSVASFIYLQNSSIQYQGSWTKPAVHQKTFYPTSFLQVIGRSLATHHRGLGLGIVNYLTGEIASFFNNVACSLSWQWLWGDLRDAGDYDPRQRIQRCADIGHHSYFNLQKDTSMSLQSPYFLHLPPLLFILLSFLRWGKLSGALGWASPAYLDLVVWYSLFGVHKYFSSVQFTYFQTVRRQAVL